MNEQLKTSIDSCRRNVVGFDPYIEQLERIAATWPARLPEPCLSWSTDEQRPSVYCFGETGFVVAGIELHPHEAVGIAYPEDEDGGPPTTAKVEITEAGLQEFYGLVP